MGKVSPQNRKSKTSKYKRRLRNSSNKYLKPGALAQIRYSKAKSVSACTDIGKKRVGVFAEDEKIEGSGVQDEGIKGVDESSMLSSPVRSVLNPVGGDINVSTPNNLQRTPKTPCAADECDSDSRLEALPMDLLVKIMCHLHHDQLRAVFHVSQRIRKSVVIARQYYFNYTTPDRSRQEMLRALTPLAKEHWPFSKGDGKGIFLRSPKTPPAPRHGPRPPRIKFSEGPQTGSVLFPEPSFSARCMGTSALRKTRFKTIASNRVLFSEDELCHAVAQNTLR